MSTDDLASRYEDRLRRYCGLQKAPEVSVQLLCDEGKVNTYSAQVALLTAASLSTRLFPSVVLSVPDVPVVPLLAAKNESLAEAMDREIRAGRPEQLRVSREKATNFRRISLRYGDGPCDIGFFGQGWNALVGRVLRSPVGPENPFGAALSATIACSEAFLTAAFPDHVLRDIEVDTWSWTSVMGSGPEWLPGADLGEVWTVGVGSVGTSALHFMALSNLRFRASLFDQDVFMIENLSRSPVFSTNDVEGTQKVDLVAAYLRARGIEVRHCEAKWLAESSIWQSRSAGEPDLLVSTANERHVRWHIESMYPPVQIHASTGGNWQATVFRHIPVVDPCSLCIFPDSGVSAPAVCASGEVVNEMGERIDASLPFLSYGAGLMIAVEAYKLSRGHAGTPSRRGYLQFRGTPHALTLPAQRLASCSCTKRDSKVHRAIIEGSRFHDLSN